MYVTASINRPSMIKASRRIPHYPITKRHAMGE